MKICITADQMDVSAQRDFRLDPRHRPAIYRPMTSFTRRTLLASGAAALALPARSQAPLDAVLERARGFDQLHALMIARAGEQVVSERVRGPALDRPANVKSVSKTIVATLLGAAIDRGVVPGADATLADVAPRLLPRGADPRAGGITLGNLASLQAGLERTSGPNYGPWVSSGNWVADALSRPMIAEPGTRMLYSTGSTHILGAALAEASGENLLALAREWLGRPLGVEIPAWTRDPQGYYLGGNEMALSPEAMVRFGEMIRRGGEIDGTRVVSEGWIAASFEPRTMSPWSGLAYGYGWFLGRSGGADVALARGFGGQVIAVVPDRALTIAITSDPTRPARSGGYFGDLLSLIDDIVAAS